jgi:hypothetical protein
MMSAMGSLGGGTFTSFFDVFFDAHFAPVGGGQGFDVFNNILLSKSGSSWAPTPPPSAVIVTGPFGNQFANTHTGLPSNEVDFWPCSVAPCSEDSSGAAHHVVSPTLPSLRHCCCWGRPVVETKNAALSAGLKVFRPLCICKVKGRRSCGSPSRVGRGEQVGRLPGLPRRKAPNVKRVRVRCATVVQDATYA